MTGSLGPDKRRARPLREPCCRLRIAAGSPILSVTMARPPTGRAGRCGRRLRTAHFRRAWAGEPRAAIAAAFETIFERYHQELYRYCLAIVRDREDAEDALQATMAAALRSLPGEEREIALRPWLFRVAHNESISLLATPPDGRRPSRGRCRSADGLRRRTRPSSGSGCASSSPTCSRCRAAALGARHARAQRPLLRARSARRSSCSEARARQTVYEARTAPSRPRGGSRDGV